MTATRSWGLDRVAPNSWYQLFGASWQSQSTGRANPTGLLRSNARKVASRRRRLIVQAALPTELTASGSLGEAIRDGMPCKRGRALIGKPATHCLVGSGQLSGYPCSLGAFLGSGRCTHGCSTRGCARSCGAIITTQGVAVWGRQRVLPWPVPAVSLVTLGAPRMLAEGAPCVHVQDEVECCKSAIFGSLDRVQLRRSQELVDPSCLSARRYSLSCLADSPG